MGSSVFWPGKIVGFVASVLSQRETWSLLLVPMRRTFDVIPATKHRSGMFSKRPVKATY